jgi:DNA (cytosine-5)-methyltransferase 1
MTALFKNWKFIDLFAGIGAFHVALKHHGAECVFASEINSDAASVYETNHGLKPHGDITKIAAEDVPEHDILCAGFPCQAFSIGGRKLGFDDTRGTLFFDVVRIAMYHQPRVLLLENVKNLESHDRGRTFAVMKAALEEIGYRVYHKVIDASDFWTPQKRERIYIVCLRADIKLDHAYFWPMKGVAKYCVDDFLDRGIQRPMKQEYLPEGEFNGRADRIARVGRFKNGTQGYRVYDPRGLGVTLCSAGGGGGANTGLYMIEGAPRVLTARECARLTGFGDSFVMHPSEKKAVRQFGNSIVVPVLTSIVSTLSLQLDRHYRLMAGIMLPSA